MELSAKLAGLGSLAGFARAPRSAREERAGVLRPAPGQPGRGGEGLLVAREPEEPVERSVDPQAEEPVERSVDPQAEEPVERSVDPRAEPSVEGSAEALAEDPPGGLAAVGPTERLVRLRRMLDGVIARQRARDGAGSGAGSGVAITALDALALARAPAPPSAPPAVARALPGARRATPHGPVHVAEVALPPEHCHGRVPIVRALLQDPEVIAELALDPALSAVELDGMLLLDTETTGLSGGTGTIPFLIGLARFEERSLLVEQLLLSTPGEEEPMLRLLVERLGRATMLVTYNGKSFDWPLLATRLVLHRVAPPPLPPHLDLLHVVRRIYKRRLGESRLVRMERELLGFTREHDIDGVEIPALYWAYVRGGRGEQLSPVLEHNVNDLVALAGLLAVVPERFARVFAEDEPIDQLCRARVALRAGDRARAEAFAVAAAEGGGGAEVTIGALVLSARLAETAGDPGRADRLYTRALEAAADDRGVAAKIHLALAKLAEHRLRDPARAIAHATFTAPAEGGGAQARRLERLGRRLERLGRRRGAQVGDPAPHLGVPPPRGLWGSAAPTRGEEDGGR